MKKKVKKVKKIKKVKIKIKKVKKVKRDKVKIKKVKKIKKVRKIKKIKKDVYIDKINYDRKYQTRRVIECMECKRNVLVAIEAKRVTCHICLLRKLKNKKERA